MRTKVSVLISLIMFASLLLSACAPAAPAPAAQPSDSARSRAQPKRPQLPHPRPAAPAKKVDVNWWHISTKDPGLSYWQKLADDYMAPHPNVNDQDHGARERSLQDQADHRYAVRQSARHLPELGRRYDGRAGQGRLAEGHHRRPGRQWRRVAQHLRAGRAGGLLVRGQEYGVPWDMGMVGWWYNKDLFAKAGIQAPPKTWTEFLDDVKKLKAAGITPIALGEKDSWTGMHIWSYLATAHRRARLPLKLR